MTPTNEQQPEVRRERGRGAIYQRPGISAFWWMRFYKNGKQYRMSTAETDEKKALRVLNAKLKERDGELVGGKKMVTPAQSRITVNELLTVLELDYKLRGKSGARLLSNLKPLQEHFGPARANQLSSADVDKFIESALQHGRRKLEKGKLGKPARPASINRSLQLLSQSYKLAIRTGRLSAAPYIRRLSEVGNARAGFFSNMELRSVVSNLPEYLQDFTLFAFLCGWRCGEIKSLRWADLDGDTIKLRAENSKNRHARAVPLVGELAEILERRRLLMSTKTDLIFHNADAPVGDFRKAWKTASKLAGVNRLFHDLRRSFVRDATRSGTPQSVVMAISGHKTVSVFLRYNITNDADVRTALLDRQNYSATEKERTERAALPVTEVVQ